MKKNKTIAYMLAATLLVGGTFVGTKALFTDQATENSKLVITTGTVDISVSNDDGWKIKKNITGEASGSNNSFTNLKTGDILSRSITIKNNGSLASKITSVNVEGLPQVLIDQNGIEYIDSQLTNLKDITLQPNDNQAGGNDEITVELTMEIKGNHTHVDSTATKEGYLNKNGGFNLSFADTKYTINAQQIDEIKNNTNQDN